MPSEIGHSFLHEMRIQNFGCVGDAGLTILLDDIVCLVGPNNSGKSTVLRAYEAAVGLAALRESDLCALREGRPTVIELSVHIPEGVPNIDEKWKRRMGDLRLVRSRWVWERPGKPTRQTFNPAENDWAEEGNASGVDQVFASRLPQPFRIEALDGPEEEHSRLLTLILQPISDELDRLLNDEGAEVSRKRAEFLLAARAPVEMYKGKIAAAQASVAKSYSKIFSSAELELNVGMAPPDIDVMKSLISGSSLKVREHGSACEVGQQGTGSQRALFWSMLEVRSALKKELDAQRATSARRAKIDKEIKAIEAKPGKQKAKIDEGQAKLERLRSERLALDTPDADGITLPGYMLLIDEPEIALHPNAVRAAKSHLYGLAAEAGWQVMLSTHSPAFVDPTVDHTTIVRLERSKTSPTPRLFRSDASGLSTDERRDLQMLLQFDPTVSQLFFGSYPILVEGDTEYAGFLKVVQANPDRFPESTRPAVIRVVGKALLVPLIKVLKHFKIPFSVMHDSDSPRNRNGGVNGMWTENWKIFAAIRECSDVGLRVVHRVSLPDFERRFGLDEGSRHKPFTLWRALDDGAKLAECEALFLELTSEESAECQYPGDTFEASLTDAVLKWSSVHASDDARF